MKKSYFLSIALGTLLLGSCSKDHNNEQSSDRNDNASYVPVDSSAGSNQSNSGGSPTYDANGKATSAEDPTYNAGETQNKQRVDHSGREFNGRSKNDSTGMNSGVAGQQGGGAGVGNGGSINAASDSTKRKK